LFFIIVFILHILEVTIISFSLKVFLNYIIYFNVLISILIIIREKKQPEKTLSWALFLMAIPIVGLFFYIFFGRNWKIHKLRDDNNYELTRLIEPIIHKYKFQEYEPLIQLTAQNSDSPIFVNNLVTILQNGEKKFETLKKELKKAKHHIHLEYYIVRSDTIGTEIKNILVAKANSGVKVRFIMDRFGAITCKKSFIEEMKNNGIEIVYYDYFLAPLFRHINTQINYRNHRKIVVIDGIVGFIGGINIADEYLGKGKLGFWRDTHLMIKGSFVLGLQSVFLDDYLTIQRANKYYVFYDFDFEKYFPIPTSKGNVPMQLIQSGPESEYPSILHSIIKMITLAKDHIYITTPYFVPNESLMDVLKIAALGGINIKIMFPHTPDHALVHTASETYLYELVNCGVEVYYYNPKGFLHSKSITVDGELCTVGTANMDIRSFFLNYEINALIYDKNISTILEKDFLDDLRYCKRITSDYYENMSNLKKLKQAFARIFSSLL